MARQLAPLDRSIEPIQFAHFVLRSDPIQELVQQGSA